MTSWLMLIQEGFMELRTCRAVGMEQGQIPWTAIKVYADTYGFSETLEDFEEFNILIRACEKAAFKQQAKKRVRENGTKSSH